MAKLHKGEISINGIIIHPTDDLTAVLKKTCRITKIIRNINNFQYVFFEDIDFFELHGHIRIIFSPVGKMESISFGHRNNYEYSEKDMAQYVSFLIKHNIKSGYSYKWGSISAIGRNMHSNTPSIAIRLKDRESTNSFHFPWRK